MWEKITADDRVYSTSLLRSLVTNQGKPAFAERLARLENHLRFDASEDHARTVSLFIALLNDLSPAAMVEMHHLAVTVGAGTSSDAAEQDGVVSEDVASLSSTGLAEGVARFVVAHRDGGDQPDDLSSLSSTGTGTTVISDGSHTGVASGRFGKGGAGDLINDSDSLA